MTALITDVCDRCGNLRSVCSDPAVVAYPQRSVCYLTAAVEQMYRRTNRVFKHADPDDPTPHESDGLQWAASLYDLTPEDDFFGDAALLAAGRREETVGEQGQAT